MRKRVAITIGEGQLRTTHFYLQPTPPFRLDLTVWALRRRPRNAIDQWDSARYSRRLHIDGNRIELSVRQIAPANDPKLEVLCVHRRREVADSSIRGIVDRLLGVSVGMADFYKLAAKNDRLKALATRYAGFRPPRFPTAFEAAVNAVCCQQLSLEVGLELLNRLATAAETEHTRNRTPPAFPRPRDVARLSEQRLRELGFSRQKATTMLGLVRLLNEDERYLDRLAELDDGSARAGLLAIKGIGRWSAEYILLRGMGRLSVFPADDIAARKNLLRWLGIGASGAQSAYEQIQEALRQWRPFQGLVYFHLLLASLDERGLLEPRSGNSAQSSDRS
jgi:DNA-3-methyladenine glycosylase II